MKYRLTFICKNPVVLPVQYNQILQAALLTWIGEKKYTSFLHDQGYQNEKRTFKLYTFSNIYGPHQYDKRSKKLIFQKQIQIYLSFYTDDSHQLILQNIAERKQLRLGNERLELYDCELVNEVYTDCVIETLSPVTIHSTFETADGRKKTYYYEPRERDFTEMLRQNLVRKYMALYDEEPDNPLFEITVDKGKKSKCASIYYHGFLIKGWSGQFRITGSEEVIRMALLSGIGARNSIGMGCVLQKYTL